MCQIAKKLFSKFPRLWHPIYKMGKSDWEYFVPLYERGYGEAEGIYYVSICHSEGVR